MGGFILQVQLMKCNRNGFQKHGDIDEYFSLRQMYIIDNKFHGNGRFKKNLFIVLKFNYQTNQTMSITSFMMDLLDTF